MFFLLSIPPRPSLSPDSVNFIHLCSPSNKQANHTSNHKHMKNHGVCFLLAKKKTPGYRACPRVCLIQALEKTDFPSRCQSQKASWLRVGHCGHLPFSVLGFGLL